jgi:hypothetical protein
LEKPKVDATLVPPKEKEEMIAEPEKQVKSSPIQKYEKAVPKKDEVLKKDP